MPTIESVLDVVQAELVQEAIASPGMLADLAGLERYIAQTYSNRSFIELLQNADDSDSARVVFQLCGEWLLCANSGRDFDVADFRALCRSAASEKVRGTSIGYRGIGFKSVVGMCSQVHLVSGALEATFSRESSMEVLGSRGATPLVRIPHPLALTESNPAMKCARGLVREGFGTVFIFGGLDGQVVTDEFESFDSDHLLFLKTVASVELRGATTSTFCCRRELLSDESVRVFTSSPGSNDEWLLRRRNQVTIAFSLESGRPVALKAKDAVAHAFLPTLEQTGLGVRLQADFTTDPSRTRIILDGSTESQIDDLAAFVVDILSNELFHPEKADVGIILALTPNIDATTLGLQRRNFRSEVLGRILARMAPIASAFALAPSWLPPVDVRSISQINAGPTIVDPRSEQAAPYLPLLRFAGVKTLSIRSVLDEAVCRRLSSDGAAALIAHVVGQPIATVPVVDVLRAALWRSERIIGPEPLTEALVSAHVIDPTFLERLLSAGVTAQALERVMSASFDSDQVRKYLGASTHAEEHPRSAGSVDAEQPRSAILSPDAFRLGTAPSGEPISVVSRGVTARWRSSEILVAQLLDGLGFVTEDKSRQNLGYDLVAVGGNYKWMVEVKSLTRPGNPFALTPNEESTARQFGDNYVLALVTQNSDAVYVQFVHAPLEKLTFVKQCQQWAWECNDYAFEPTHVLPI